MPAGRCSLVVLVAATFMAGTSAAHGDEPGKAQFDRGLADMLAGRCETGCPALAESYREAPFAGAPFTLAEGEARWGKLASAAEHYRPYLAKCATMPPGDRTQQAGRIEIARQQVANLEAAVPPLPLTLPPGAPTGGVMELDGKTLAETALRTPMSLDPGEHQVVVASSWTAPGAMWSAAKKQVANRPRHRRVRFSRSPLRQACSTHAADELTNGPGANSLKRWEIQQGLVATWQRSDDHGYIGRAMSRATRKLGELLANLDLRSVLSLLAIFALVVALWGTFVVTPLKIFVVLLHEISHGLAAVLTGGSIVRIEINAQQGGVCFTAGGLRFVITSAGYLGSMLWGVVVLVLSSRPRVARWVSIAIGAFVLLVTLFYVRSLFGFAFGLLFGGFLAFMGAKLGPALNAFVLQIVGVTSCLYAVLDIVDDVLRRPGIGSDADALAEMTLIPGVVWGVLWIATSVAVTAVGLLVAAQKRPPSSAAARPGGRARSARPS